MAWIDDASRLTPWEVGASGTTYKREDLFAPLGYGGPNGSKLRQLVHLVDQAKRDGATGVLTGCSVLSPQGSMAALVAREYGLPCTVVYGAAKPHTAVRHDNVAIAAMAGADFEFVPVGFNPALQRSVDRLAAEPRYAGRYRLCYGITTPADADGDQLLAFHSIGAAQVRNIPDRVRTLVVPFGSANSATSILLGLALGSHAVEEVVLVGIGPPRLTWMRARLSLIAIALGLNLNLPDVRLVDLHSTGVYRYADRVPWTVDGIQLHPTYEGKVAAYAAAHPDQVPSGPGVGLWIVGSAPSREVTAAALRT